MSAEEENAAADIPAAESDATEAAFSAAPVDLPTLDPGAPQPQVKGQSDINMKMILDLPVDVHVELGQAKMTIQNILAFSIGTVIELERLAGEPVDIVINGKLIGKGEVMVVDENFGIRITELVEPEKRVESL